MIGTNEPFGTIYAQDMNKISSEHAKICFKLSDGFESFLSFKDYMRFLGIYKHVPDDCKNEEEYNEKVMVLKI